ncbi:MULTISPECIES: hypothetical protein [Paenibacillus]|uniref:Uncharacterized protein n=1 Tax=Paenibacillus odorifer TaxID=189426 RepID=A0AB36JHE6_9BACL|nr:hypothetical protein [Paenibacillus odorifer]OMD87773.1 hypothetical protein BSK53_01945 [Paenibacillus odorifer]OME16425.1 hypothetical protein BSK60_08855 [Paenibacillus odorifer]OME19522.1 hypothetical protein BSK47_15920 [Paenibacillus odorifer]
MSKPNVDEIAAALFEKLQPLYIKDGLELTQELQNDGKPIQEAIRQADLAALKLHNERFTIELIKGVLDALE